MVRDDEEPGDGEGGRVGGVDDRVEDVEPRECEAVERRRRRADLPAQQDGEHERHQRVDVHGQLQRVQPESRQQRQEAVEPRDFVEEHGERDELRAGAERHEVQERLGPRDPNEACETHFLADDCDGDDNGTRFEADSFGARKVLKIVKNWRMNLLRNLHFTD